MIKNIKNLIFDLDKTLYPEHESIDECFANNFYNYLKKYHKMTESETAALVADTKKKGTYWAVKDCGIDADALFEYLCDVDVSVIEYNEELKAKLLALPHRQIIYTNATIKHTKAVLERLGLEDVLKDRFTYLEADYHFKPRIEGFKKFLECYGINPCETAMFEDSVENLETAKKLGMTTVLISAESVSYPYVDHVFPDINSALDIFY